VQFGEGQREREDKAAHARGIGGQVDQARPGLDQTYDGTNRRRPLLPPRRDGTAL
jgi:hypothetical protein